MGRNNHLLHFEDASHSAGVNGTGSTETDQEEVAQVSARSVETERTARIMLELAMR